MDHLWILGSALHGGLAGGGEARCLDRDRL